MTRDDVKGFATRDWPAVRDADAAYWAAEYDRRGPSATVNASRALWEHARLIRPEWPTAADSARDLTDLLQLKQQLDRAAHAFARR